MRVRMVVLLAVLAGAATVYAHDDVVPYEVDGRIGTGGHDDVLGTDTVEKRVFGYDFGEDPGDPFIIGDPGFNNGAFGIGIYPNDGLLPGGLTLGFSVLSNLQYWDGAGAVAFGAAPTDAALGLKRGSFTAVVSGSGTSGTVPTIGSTGAGRLHVHLESQLLFEGSANLGLPNAPEGIYLVGLELTLPGSGLANSDSIWFVYNNALDEEIHDAAIDWVEASLVPEPASWALMLSAIAGLAAAGWRRRVRGAASRS